jgi:hypothetical protein
VGVNVEPGSNLTRSTGRGSALSATLENEADATLENEATGSLVSSLPCLGF